MPTHALRCLEELSSVDCLHLIFSEIFDKQNAITMYIWSVLFSKESIWSSFEPYALWLEAFPQIKKLGVWSQVNLGNTAPNRA